MEIDPLAAEYLSHVVDLADYGCLNPPCGVPYVHYPRVVPNKKDAVVIPALESSGSTEAELSIEFDCECGEMHVLIFVELNGNTYLGWRKEE